MQNPPRHRLRISQRLSTKARNAILEISHGLPIQLASPIFISAQPRLTAHRGKLLSRLGLGTPVQAATFIRNRRIVLDEELFRKKKALAFVFAHELFHFTWPKLGAAIRAEFDQVIRLELASRARGEIGGSAAIAKARLRDGDGELRNRRWKDYVCEAFCDTAAYTHAGPANSEHVALGQRWIRRRVCWLQREINWSKKWF